MIAFLSPIFSANAPKNGAPNPQARFWIAIARLNSARGQSNSSWIGIWKTPKEARIAKPTSTIMQPTTNTGVISRGRFSMQRHVVLCISLLLISGFENQPVPPIPLMNSGASDIRGRRRFRPACKRIFG